MSETGELKVFRVQYVEDLLAKSKLWVLGWVLAGLMVFAMAGMLYQNYALTKEVALTRMLQQEAINTQYVNAQALIDAWENAKATQKALIDWAEYSTERINILQLNAQTKPFSRKEALTKRPQ